MNENKIKKKIEKEFDYVNAKAMEMREEAEHMAGDARERFGREVDGLKARADRLRSEFDSLSEETVESADSLREKFSRGLDEIKNAFKQMRDRFK